MKLQTFKTLWGNDSPITKACQQARDAGFDGIEGQAPDDAMRPAWQEALQRHQCTYVAEIVSGGDYVPDRRWSVQQHLDDIQRQIENALPLQPLFANCIVGCDAWPEAKAIDFFEQALMLEKAYGLTLSFETHRSRPTYNPWSTVRIAHALPDLKLTADISHWCVVCERLMDSETETLTKLIPQVHHLHARVGYDQGPQVPDPRAPEYQPALQSHLRFWQKIMQYKRQTGCPNMTMTPEFGPDGYCHLQPYTQMPVVDIWEINRWVNNLLKETFVELPLSGNDYGSH